MDFWYFSKKCQIRFLKWISLQAHILPAFLPRLPSMVKQLLKSCRVGPWDAFTYLSWSHIISRSNFRIREKFFSNFIFYAYFIKGNFKALPEKLFSAGLTKFFRRILKLFWYQKPYRLEVWRCSYINLSRFSLWFMRFWVIFHKIA